MPTERDQAETTTTGDPGTEGAAPVRDPAAAPGFRVFRFIMDHVGNPLMKRVLRGRPPGPLARNVMLLRFQGRRSGRWYETPVGYARDGDVVVSVSSPSYRWWRNVAEGADVRVKVAGVWFDAHGRVVPPRDPEYDPSVDILARARGPRALLRLGLPVDETGRVPDAARARSQTSAVVTRFVLRRRDGGPVASP